MLIAHAIRRHYTRIWSMRVQHVHVCKHAIAMVRIIIFKKKSIQTPTAAAYYTRSDRFDAYTTHMGEIIKKIIINWRRKNSLVVSQIFVRLLVSLCVCVFVFDFNYLLLFPSTLFGVRTMHTAQSLKKTTKAAAATIDSIMCSLKWNGKNTLAHARTVRIKFAITDTKLRRASIGAMAKKANMEWMLFSSF